MLSSAHPVYRSSQGIVRDKRTGKGELVIITGILLNPRTNKTLSYEDSLVEMACYVACPWQFYTPLEQRRKRLHISSSTLIEKTGLGMTEAR